jgi:hypothetical protein
MRIILPFLLLLLLGCQKDDHSDVIPDEKETIEYLKNDISFIIGKWELTYFEPTVNNRSWIVFKSDNTFEAYFVFPENPYTSEPTGTYLYSDGVVSLICKDGGKITLEFVSITGRNSANKILYTHFDDSGNSFSFLYIGVKNKITE